jgi:hypothetical protein
MAKRKYIHHGSKRNLKKDLGSYAASATVDHSLNDGDMVEIAITAAACVVLNITDVWDGAKIAISALSSHACGCLAVKVNGTAVDAIASTASAFTKNDHNFILVHVVDDAGDIHPTLYTTI